MLCIIQVLRVMRKLKNVDSLGLSQGYVLVKLGAIFAINQDMQRIL